MGKSHLRLVYGRAQVPLPSVPRTIGTLTDPSHFHEVTLGSCFFPGLDGDGRGNISEQLKAAVNTSAWVLSLLPSLPNVPNAKALPLTPTFLRICH